jgi:hypothetical protein
MPPPLQQMPVPSGAAADSGARGAGSTARRGRCGSPRRAAASMTAITTASPTAASTIHFSHAIVAIAIGAAICSG